MAQADTKRWSGLVLTLLTVGAAAGVLAMTIWWFSHRSDFPGSLDAGSSKTMRVSSADAPDPREGEPVPETGVGVGADEQRETAAVAPNPATDRFRQALGYQRPISDALEEAARDGLLTDKQLLGNLAWWEPLCASVNRLGDGSGRIALSDHDIRTRQDIEEFCRGFTRDTQQRIDDHLDVELSSGGSETIRSLRDPLNLADPERAVQSAIRSLVDALDRLDYGGVQDIVWFIGTEIPISVDESADTTPLETMSPDPEVLISVGAATFCRELGRCNGEHPVTVGLCVLLEDRPCRDAQDIEAAIYQMLTGLEIERFLSMFNRLQVLIARHRAGDF